MGARVIENNKTKEQETSDRKVRMNLVQEVVNARDARVRMNSSEQDKGKRVAESDPGGEIVGVM